MTLHLLRKAGYETPDYENGYGTKSLTPAYMMSLLLAGELEVFVAPLGYASLRS